MLCAPNTKQHPWLVLLASDQFTAQKGVARCKTVYRLVYQISQL